MCPRILVNVQRRIDDEAASGAGLEETRNALIRAHTSAEAQK